MVATGIIWLRKYDPDDSTAIIYQFKIKSREVFGTDLQCPVVIDPMAFQKKENATAMQISGNRMDISLEWYITDKNEDMAFDGALVALSPSIRTADDQASFLNNTYEPDPSKMFGQKYEIELEGVNPLFKKVGVITRLKCVQTRAESSQYRATLSFTVAQMLAEFNFS